MTVKCSLLKWPDLAVGQLEPRVTSIHGDENMKSPFGSGRFVDHTLEPAIRAVEDPNLVTTLERPACDCTVMSHGHHMAPRAAPPGSTRARRASGARRRARPPSSVRARGWYPRRRPGSSRTGRR